MYLPSRNFRSLRSMSFKMGAGYRMRGYFEASLDCLSERRPLVSTLAYEFTAIDLLDRGPLPSIEVDGARLEAILLSILLQAPH